MTVPGEPESSSGTPKATPVGPSSSHGVTVLRNTSWLTAQPLILNFISLASTGYIARVIGEDGFGRFNFGLGFVAMFAPLTAMGMRGPSLRFMAQNPHSIREYLGQTLLLRMGLAVVTALIATSAAYLYAPTAELRVVAIIAVTNLISTTAATTLIDGYQAVERMRDVAIANAVGGLTLTVLSVVAAASVGTVPAVLGAYLIGPPVTFLYLWYRASGVGLRPQLTWSWTEVRARIRESLPFFGQGAVESVTGRLDLLMLVRRLGDGGLGAYTAAQGLVSRAGTVVDGTATAMLPTLSRLAKEDRHEATRLLSGTATGLMALTLPAAVVLAFASSHVMRLVFGPEFSNAGFLLMGFAVLLPIDVVQMIAGQGLFAASRNRAVVSSALVGAAVRAILVLLLVWQFGAVGAIIGLASGTVVTLALRLPVLLKEYPQLLDNVRVWPILLATASTGTPWLLFQADSLLRALGLGLVSATLWLLVAVKTAIIPRPWVVATCRVMGLRFVR